MSKLKFLVVEDDLFYQTYVNDLLAEAGVDIVTASDGETGLNLALAERPDLILSDIEIPKIQGFVLLRNLRDRPETKDIPVILMSGKVEKDLLERHSQLQVHADGYLMKPFSGQDLINLIGHVLGPEAGFGSDKKKGEEENEDEHPETGDVQSVEPDPGLELDTVGEVDSRGPRQVIVVDDSPYICDIASDFLKEIGFEVTTAQNGEDGLKAVLRNRPDLILLDVQMPKMNGFVVCEILRKEETTKDIPIVLMSAVVDGESFERHSKLRYHADDYLQKPFMKSELQELARKYISPGSGARPILEKKTGFLLPSEDDISGGGSVGEAASDPFENPRVKEKLEKARSVIEELKGKEAELAAQLEKTVVKRDRLEEEVFELRSGKGSREQELMDKLTLVTQRFEETRDRLDQFEKNGGAPENRQEDARLKDRLEILSADLEELNTANSLLETENQTLKNEIEKFVRNEEQNLVSLGKIEVSEEKVREFSTENEELKRDLAAAVSAKAEIEEQVANFFTDRDDGEEKRSLKDQLKKLRDENRELLGRITEAEVRIKRFSDVESQEEKAREELRALREQLREGDQNREAEASALEEKLSEVSKKSEILEKEKADLEGVLEKFRGEVDTIKVRLDDAKKTAAYETAARMDLEGRIEKTGEEKRKIASELEETRGRLNELNGQIPGGEELRRELEEEKVLRVKAEAEIRVFREKSGTEAKQLNERLEQMETTFGRTVHEAQEVISSQKNEENELREKLDTLVSSLNEEKEAYRREREHWRKKEEEQRFAFEDALAENRKIIGEEASRLYPMHVPRHTRPLEVVTGTRKLVLLTILAMVFLLVIIFGYVVLSRIGGEKQQGFVPETSSDLSTRNQESLTARPGNWSSLPEDTSSYEDIWRRQTVQSVSEDMMIQATLHSWRELEAAILYTASKEGWTRQRKEKTLGDVVNTYDLEGSYFVTIFSKNLKGGYPGYADDFEKHVTLRDNTGGETMASLPVELERKKFITSRISAAGKEMNPVFLYEVGLTVAFSRDELADKPEGLQLVLYDIGAVPVRVLTWDLSTMGPLSSRPRISRERNS